MLTCTRSACCPLAPLGFAILIWIWAFLVVFVENNRLTLQKRWLALTAKRAIPLPRAMSFVRNLRNKQWRRTTISAVSMPSARKRSEDCGSENYGTKRIVVF